MLRIKKVKKINKTYRGFKYSCGVDFNYCRYKLGGIKNESYRYEMCSGGVDTEKR